MNKRDYEQAIEREVENWPGVTVEFANPTGKGHPRAKFSFEGKLLAQSYAGTPSDGAFGVHQMLGDMRRTMKKLGAVRDKPEPSKDEDEAPYRKPNPGADMRTDPVREKATPKPTVADQLVAAGAATPEQRRAVQEEKSAGTYARAAQMVEDVADATAQLRAEFEARVAGIVDGIYFGLPSDVYHAVPRLSSSGIQKLCVSPATFWRGSWLDPDRPDQDEDSTIWQLLGRAYHTARLEPHLFEQLYVRELDKSECPEGTLFTGPEMGKKLEDMGLKKSGSVLEQAERLADSGYPSTQLWPLIKAAWEDERGARTPLPAKHYDQMLTDRERIGKNSQIAPLLTGGEAEVSVFWTDEHGIKMKARIDYLNRDWWADFKTFDNSRGKRIDQALNDAMRYNRYYVQAVVYRDAVEAMRRGAVQIIGEANDDQRALVAHLQMKPQELACWYIFQEKGGVPNLLAREFPFYTIPYTTIFAEAGVQDERRIAAGRELTRHKTQLAMRGQHEQLEAKKAFVLYSEVYPAGEPWFPIDSIGQFNDDDFPAFWLEGG